MADDFETNIENLTLRIGSEAKALRTYINGNLADLSTLGTTNKSNLVAAINEVLALVGAGPENAQPLDSDLTAISGLSTTAYGRDLLTLADQAALMLLLSAATESARGIVELSTISEAVAGTDMVRAVTPAGLQAALSTFAAGAPDLLNTLDEIAAALGDDPNFAATITTALSNKQEKDSTLTALAGVTTVANQLIYATGSDTFTTTSITAFARTLIAGADAAAMRATLDVYSKAEIGDVTHDYVADFEAALQ